MDVNQTCFALQNQLEMVTKIVFFLFLGPKIC